MDDEATGSKPAVRWDTIFPPLEPPPATAPDIPDIGDLSARLVELSSRIDGLITVHQPPEEVVRSIQDAFMRTAQAGANLTTRVLLPPDETMAVPLVVANELYHLEDYHSEENRAWAFFGIMAGALLGQIGSFVFMLKPPPQGAWIILVVLLVGTLLSGMEIRRIRKNIMIVKNRWFSHVVPRKP